MSPAKKYYKPRPATWRQCECGCGTAIKGTPRRKYLDATHRKRANRQRLKKLP